MSIEPVDRHDVAGQAGLDRDLDGLRHAVERQLAGRGRGDRLRRRPARRRARSGCVSRNVAVGKRVRLDRLAAQLAVAPVVVALERRQVRGDLDRGDRRAVEDERAGHVGRPPDRRVGLVAGERLVDAVADERRREVGERADRRVDRPRAATGSAGSRLERRAGRERADGRRRGGSTPGDGLPRPTAGGAGERRNR